MARDRYKYFRVEAAEVLEGLGHDVLELEKGGGGEAVGRMLRRAHTLKGAARVVGQAEMAELSHRIEDALAPHREAETGKVPAAAVDQVLRLLDAMKERLGALTTPQAEPAAGPAASAPEAFRSVRVEIGEMDGLLEGVFETDVRLRAIRGDVEQVQRARELAAGLVEVLAEGTRARADAEELLATLERAQGRLAVGLERTEDELGQVREKAEELRLMTTRVVFGDLERAVYDAARSLGRQATFEGSGGEHRLEANILLAVRDALLHVVRNAVAHGIESPPERVRAGKPPSGVVRLEVQRRGHRIAFVCRDDGRGFDVEAIRRAAVRRGIASPERAAQLDVEELHRLALEGGLSTADAVTEVAGRGIGLEVLRATAAQVKGEIRISSDRGRGTTIDLCVPVSLSSVAALVLDAGDFVCSMPLDAVRRTLRLASSDIVRSPERDSVVIDGNVLPFIPLARALGRTASRAAARPWSAVVVQAGRQQAAVGVDRLLGTSTVVLRPLPRLAGAVAVASGASLDAEGNPQLVLDPHGLVAAAHASRGLEDAEAPAAERLPILVIDDSLTTRMLEQSILESAGYAVELATSAEDGLARARQGRYALFLVDVEMPGMDGFEFVARTRADPALRTIPAILVTSRQTADDKRRGAEAGAHAYIVKGEFDQGQLLRTIRLLIG